MTTNTNKPINPVDTRPGQEHCCICRRRLGRGEMMLVRSAQPGETIGGWPVTIGEDCCGHRVPNRLRWRSAQRPRKRRRP
jgi:hypothetical protein